MPISMSYAEDGQIIHLIITDPWSLDEMTKLYIEQRQHLTAAQNKVHTLLDMQATHQIPSGLLSARQGAPTVSHPNAGELAIVGAPNFVKTLADIGFRLVRFNRARYFDDELAAWSYLREHILAD